MLDQKRKSENLDCGFTDALMELCRRGKIARHAAHVVADAQPDFSERNSGTIGLCHTLFRVALSDAFNSAAHPKGGFMVICRPIGHFHIIHHFGETPGFWPNTLFMWWVNIELKLDTTFVF
jgi:hypothetical protein